MPLNQIWLPVIQSIQQLVLIKVDNIDPLG